MFPYVTDCSWDKNRAAGGKNNKEEKFPYLIVILQAYYWIQTKSLDVVKLGECLFITQIEEGHQVSARQYRDLRGQKREKGKFTQIPPPPCPYQPAYFLQEHKPLPQNQFFNNKIFYSSVLCLPGSLTSTLQFFRNI